MLVAFEGIDRSGRSTQAIELATTLKSQGRDVVRYMFPDRSTPVGQMIDDIIKGKKKSLPETLALLSAADRAEKAAEIQQHVSNGAIVIVDRYFYTSIAHGMASGLDRKWLENLDISCPRPDKVIVVNPEHDPEHKEKEGEFQSRVAESLVSLGL